MLVRVNIKLRLGISLPVMVANPSFGFGLWHNQPWKRTVGLVDAWDHHDFGKWGYHVFCWRVGLRLLFGVWGCHDFCWCVGLPRLLFGVWDYHGFCLVRGITTTLCVWVYHNLMYVWVLFVCVHSFMCVDLS